MRNKGKKNVLLDLDQTLISAEASEEFEFKKNKGKVKIYKDAGGMHDMDGYYLVFSRPNLQKFLDYLFANFNVSVWTAASKDYALFIIKDILLGNRPERKLDYIFFSYHCELSKHYKGGSKDLSMLWGKFKLDGYNTGNTIILDDYINDVHANQPQHCIIAKPFEFVKDDSENDKYLLDLIPQLEILKEKMEEDGNTHLTSRINKNMGTI